MAPPAEGPRLETPSSTARRRLGIREVSVLVLLVVSALAAGCVGDGSPGATGSTSPAAAGPSSNATSPGSPNGTGGNATSGDPGNATAPSPEENATGPSPSAFTTWGCETTFTMLEVRKSWARRHTPDGFEPLTFFPLDALVPGAPNRSVRASFAVASNHCDRITYQGPGGNATVRTDVQKLYYGVFVDPPDAYESGRKLYLSVFRIVTTSPGEADLLARWGLPAEAGSVALRTKADRSQARSWTLAAETADVSARVDLQTPGSTGAGSNATTFRWFGAGGNGSVRRALDHTVEVGNSTQNRVAAGAMNAVVDLDAPDAPYPAPAPSPIAVTRWTPDGKAAQHAELVTFDG